MYDLTFYILYNWYYCCDKCCSSCCDGRRNEGDSENENHYTNSKRNEIIKKNGKKYTKIGTVEISPTWCCANDNTKKNNITKGKILIVRLFIHVLLKVAANIIQITVFGASENINIPGAYEKGIVSLEAYISWISEIFALLLMFFILVLCACWLDGTKTEGDFQIRCAGFKFLELLLDVCAFLFTFFMGIDLGGILDISSWLTITFSLFFIFELVDLLMDLIQFILYMFKICCGCCVKKKQKTEDPQYIYTIYKSGKNKVKPLDSPDFLSVKIDAEEKKRVKKLFLQKRQYDDL